MTTTETRPGASANEDATDPLALEAVDAVEFWVGNALQAAHFYRTGWGFDLIAYQGPETGVRDRASYVLQQGKLRLVVTSSLREGTEIARHVARHGDGAKDISLRVADASAAFAEAVRRGAVPVRAPFEEKDDFGVIRRATIAAYGETVHTFVERADYAGVYAPGYEPRSTVQDPLPKVGLTDFDHSVANVELNRMNFWVSFYEQVLGFQLIQGFTDEDISTEYSALMSKVVSDGVGRIKFPINEPAPGKKRSQVDEYLDFYGGPGLQHIAIATSDIVASVEALEARGIEFMRVPDTYYEDLRDRFEDLELDIDLLARHGILADRDDEGYLLQIFSRMNQDRPTVFFELIERHGSRGFGNGNFKALFVALEREQERRGNL
ncbi:MAG TPA: 4-hydroxyphenylpyruvate dioxygenase [Acidimicrobiales bacterium]|nr:4-hydroxyphenylpyruvate dioxygenase [Acidimicrobiales bacterium]